MTEVKDVALNELSPPPEVYGASNSGEILRAWIVDRSFQVSLAPLAFSNEAYPWGMVLVDVARHVARAFEKENVLSYREAMIRIRAMFDREWDVPTDIGTTEKLGRQ